MKHFKILLVTTSMLLFIGSIACISCKKENNIATKDIQPSAFSLPKGGVVVGHSKYYESEILLDIDEVGFLNNFIDSLNNGDPGRYIAESLNIWVDSISKDLYTPTLSISFFDMVEEHGITFFIQPDTMHTNKRIQYVVNNNSRTLRCEGKCNNPCITIKDNYGNFLMCQPCTDPMPNFDFGDISGREQWKLNHYCKAMGIESSQLSRIIQCMKDNIIY